MIKAVIFDFDGVIADTMNDNFKAWEYAFLKYNLQIEKLAYFLLEGMGPKSIANHFLETKNFDKSIAENIVFEKEEYYKNNNNLRTYPEIFKIFEIIKNKNLQIGIVTGASKSRINQTLNTELLKYVSVLITSDDIKKTKPDPEPYLTAIKYLNLQACNCIVVENAILGINSAKAAGCLCFAIETTLDSEKLQNADICFKNHAALLEYFKTESI
jgi:beta-phosphoglucomutase